eukprot:COSAG04_NODE_640_length_11672_cov_32.635358_14_plen_117_part_00
MQKGADSDVKTAADTALAGGGGGEAAAVTSVADCAACQGKHRAHTCGKSGASKTGSVPAAGRAASGGGGGKGGLWPLPAALERALNAESCATHRLSTFCAAPAFDGSRVCVRVQPW